MLKEVKTYKINMSNREDFRAACLVFTFFELTTTSSEPNLIRLAGLSVDLDDERRCWFFSRTVANCEEELVTDGLVRRPRVSLDSMLSPVERVEVLAQEECLRPSGWDLGDSARVST